MNNLTGSNDLYSQTLRRTYYLHPERPVLPLIAIDSKVLIAQKKITEKFIEICMTVESESAPYPTVLSEVRPYFNYVLSVCVEESELKKLDERVKALAKVIITNILKSSVEESEFGDFPSKTLNSMIDAVGAKNTIDFISVIELKTLQQLVCDIESDYSGLLDRLQVELNNLTKSSVVVADKEKDKPNQNSVKL